MTNVEHQTLVANKKDNTDKPIVFAKTLGHFDLFIDSKPIHFTSKKGKELLVARLKQTLDEVGIGDILVSTRGVRSIDTSKVIYDCWEAMNGNDYYIKAFQGVYMLNYSWGEEKQ